VDPEKLNSNLEAVQQRISAACQRSGRSPGEVDLIAVTKGVAAATLEEAFKLGVRHFGENRVQEAGAKIKSLTRLSPPPTWHMIGHLQSNKVNSCLELFDCIESLDSVPLAQAIHRRATRIMPVLLQLNLAGESSKGGFSFQELKSAFETIRGLTNLKILGLMTIAPVVDDPEEVRPLFRQMKKLRDELGVEQLSMGMTDDFEVAIEEGATRVRIGRGIFGERTDPSPISKIESGREA
jgi:pyridoxal phosphate enzyme (YggS family)